MTQPVTSTLHASDGRDLPPRIEIFQATWAMRELPGAGPWDPAGAIERVRDAGFSGIMHWVADETADFAVIEQIRRAGLFAGVGFPDYPGSTHPALFQRARDLGASFLNVQIHDSFVLGEEALRRMDALYARSDAAGVPLFIETHRGTVTQDLLRTVDFARQRPRLRFTLDASHYVVAGEVRDPAASPRFNDELGEIIRRSASLHARVSNGEQVQVDIGDGTGPLASAFAEWWRAAYRHWLKDAARGEFFPFVCELGPPPYGIAVPEGSGLPAGELSDRWSQALVLKRMAEKIAAG